MGRHRSATSGRGISRGLIVAIAALVVVVAVVVAWLVLRGTTADEGARASETCVSGDLTVHVAAAPGIAPAIRDLADHYAEGNPVVRDHCITVDVRNANATDILAAPSSEADSESTRPEPALWIAESSADVAQLHAIAPDRIDGAPASIAASPIVLAAGAEAADRAGGIAWQDLPARQSAGDLGLAMPAGGNAPATELTLAAAIANSGDDPTGSALSAADVDSAAGRSATRDLLGAAPGDRSSSPSDVLDALQSGTEADGVHMVPTTAHRLSEANRNADDAGLTAVRPAGATPVADFPAVLLRRDRAEDPHTVSAAGSDFMNFLTSPSQQSQLAGRGFLIEDGTHDSTDAAEDSSEVLTGRPPESILPGPADDAVTALASAIDAAAPAGASSTTVLLDVSGSMSAHEGGTTRLDNVSRALDRRIGSLPDSERVGLRIYSANLAGARASRVIVPTGPLSDDIGAGTSRRQALATGLGATTSRTSTHTYSAVQEAYASAVEGYTDGGPNSLLLITDGPNDDQSFKSTRRLLDSVDASADPARAVAINMIVIGPNPDLDSLQELADSTSGTLVQVPSSTDEAFGDALEDLLD